MPEYHTEAIISPGIFIVTPYEAGDKGVLVPQMPSSCPLMKDEEHCRFRIHHWRERKTGPSFPLAVVRCHTHNKTLTFYPPGYAPYMRKEIAPMAPDGSFLLHDDAEVDPGPPNEHKDGSESHDEVKHFEDTYFKAALDGAQGKAWPRCSPKWGDGGLERYWSTQLRQLEVCTRLLGVSDKQDQKEREAVAESLGVELMLLTEQSQAIFKEPGYRSRSQAVCNVLAALPRNRCVADRLLTCGYLVGQWGDPYRWDSKRAVFIRRRHHKTVHD